MQAEAEGEAAVAAGAELGLLLKDAAAGWADAARSGEVHAQVRLLAEPRTPSAGGVLRQAAPHAQAKASTEARAKALQADGPGPPGAVTPVAFSTANPFCVGAQIALPLNTAVVRPGQWRSATGSWTSCTRRWR